LEEGLGAGGDVIMRDAAPAAAADGEGDVARGLLLRTSARPTLNLLLLLSAYVSAFTLKETTLQSRYECLGFRV
jgi:hypothetical protein